MTNGNLSHKEAYDLYEDILEKPLAYAQQAASLRDRYYSSLSFSKNFFIPLTHWCRNQCLYCQFRKETGSPYLSEKEILSLINQAKKANCSEVLLTLGEKPEQKYPLAQKWLEENGYKSTVDYLITICTKILDNGLLPHSNPGVINSSELQKLAQVNASLGLMIESTSTRLLEEGNVHAKSPTKNPKVRLQVIDNAGKLKIPFTTGLLIGIGETPKETINGLLKINDLFKKYKHIQEVIIQNLVLPLTKQEELDIKVCSFEKIQSVTILARLLLSPEISIQVPPNLNKGFETKLIDSGINDWGGISPVTNDYVNPGTEWPTIDELKRISRSKGLNLTERLPVYPHFINSGWLRPKVLPIAKVWQERQGNHH